MNHIPLSVVALARNEEKNMAQCLDRFAGWADQVFIVVDDRTNDATVAIAQKYGAEVVVRKFGDFVAQRNWALRNLPFRNEWVLFIDPDEYPTEELKREIVQVVNGGGVTPPASPYGKGRLGEVKQDIGINIPFPSPYDKGRLGEVTAYNSPDHSYIKRGMILHNSSPYDKGRLGGVNGYYIKRRFIFWGKWLKHGGYYPVWILRLMRHRVARCEGVKMDEHFAVEGTTGRLASDLVHDDRRGLRDWFQKHRAYAEFKALEYIAGGSAQGPTGSDAISRERVAKRELWDKLPLFVRPFLYWGYTMFVRGGFLDGIPGIVFHTLRGFWYPLLIDREIVRLRRKSHLS
ncbi:MAG: glycosyltransferase family 2 protein [Candidatus Jorgensenbacteria bacterium]